MEPGNRPDIAEIRSYNGSAADAFGEGALYCRMLFRFIAS